MLDRLKLDEKRVEAMARAIEDIAALADPIGTVLAEWTRPNGMVIQRRRVPLGVIGIIYESRPNVTADAGALVPEVGQRRDLARRFGERAIECRHSRVLGGGIDRRRACRSACIQLVPTTDRAAVGYMLARDGEHIDVIVPRGGKNLIARVQQEARVPVIGHLEGVCHVYVDRRRDLEMAKDIVLNAKMRRTGVCGAAETLLVDRGCAATHLAPLVEMLLDAGCEVRGDERRASADARVKAGDRTGLVHRVPRCHHRGARGRRSWTRPSRTSGPTARSIPTASSTDDAAAAERFLTRVDSAIVLHNASTQFADGGEFGMGAEIGISTDKFHARGPGRRGAAHELQVSGARQRVKRAPDGRVKLERQRWMASQRAPPPGSPSATVL